MVQSAAKTVKAHLAELPPDRRKVVAAVRKVILANLPTGYEERMNWGMIAYEIPLSRYPKTDNGQPLAYAALAAQKNFYALYLMCVYSDPAQESSLRAAFKAAGKTLDRGKSCVRFRVLEDLPLDAIGAVIASAPPEKFIARHEAARKGR